MSDEERYSQLANKVTMGMPSELIPKLWELIASPEEADLLLALPGTADDMAGKLQRPEEEVREMLGLLFHKGLAFKKEKPEGTVFRMCRDLMQFHDASILWPEAPEEFLDLWRQFMETEWKAFSELADKFPKPLTRVVPVSEAVDARQQILAFEDVSRMIEEETPIAVANCTCRLVARKCDRPVEICMQVGKAAEYSIERGTGREVDREEALSLLRQAEEAGLIHVTMNRASQFHFICNCCDDCCMTFPLLIEKKLKLCDPSRYVATVDEAGCNGCGDCLERCYFGALELDDALMVARVNGEECMGCGLCQVACSPGAISLVECREVGFVPT